MRPKSSRSRSEGGITEQKSDTSLFTNRNVTTTSMTIRIPASVSGTTLSPTTTPVTISYLNDNSYYISTFTSIRDSSSKTIVTTVIYLNYYNSSNARKLILKCGLISKSAHLGNKFGQPDVVLGQLVVNINLDGESFGMTEPSVEALLAKPLDINFVFYFDINSNVNVFTTTIVTATASDSFPLTSTSFSFESEITLSTATIRTNATAVSLSSITTLFLSTSNTLSTTMLHVPIIQLHQI